METEKFEKWKKQKQEELLGETYVDPWEIVESAWLERAKVRKKLGLKFVPYSWAVKECLGFQINK